MSKVQNIAKYDDAFIKKQLYNQVGRKVKVIGRVIKRKTCTKPLFETYKEYTLEQAIRNTIKDMEGISRFKRMHIDISTEEKLVEFARWLYRYKNSNKNDKTCKEGNYKYFEIEEINHRFTMGAFMDIMWEGYGWNFMSQKKTDYYQRSIKTQAINQNDWEKEIRSRMRRNKNGSTISK